MKFVDDDDDDEWKKAGIEAIPQHGKQQWHASSTEFNDLISVPTDLAVCGTLTMYMCG